MEVKLRAPTFNQHSCITVLPMLGTTLGTILDVFLNIVQTAFDPPPLVLNIYVADSSKGLLKRCVNACRDKCVKIVRKSLEKISKYQKIVTILPSICDNSTPRRHFYVNLYCQIASRIIPNLQQKLLNMGLTPPPPEQC